MTVTKPTETLVISNHEGKKYLRRVRSAVPTKIEQWVLADVYSVLVAWEVNCPARAHAIKKLLCAGQRGKGDELADLIGALAAVSRAIEIQKDKEQQDNGKASNT